MKVEKIINRDLDNANKGLSVFRQSDAVSFLTNSFEDLAVSFSLFCAQNFSAQYFNYDKQLWFERNTGKEYTTEELYKLWKN